MKSASTLSFAWTAESHQASINATPTIHSTRRPSIFEIRRTGIIKGLIDPVCPYLLFALIFAQISRKGSWTLILIAVLKLFVIRYLLVMIMILLCSFN